MKAILSPIEDILWPNCTIPDCCNKACVGLSNTLCFPHYFKLPMDREGNAIYPNEKIKRKYRKILHEALNEYKKKIQ